MIDKEILDAVLPLPTLDELKEQKVEELKDEGFVISNFHSGGVFYTMLMIVLRIKVEVIELLRAVLNNMFVSHAGGAWLDLKMADYSKKRKKAQKTQGFVTVRRTDMTGEAVKIPKGHVFKSILDINGEELRFFALEAATLQKGASSVDVLVEAETEGNRYNVPAGQIVRTLTYLGDVTFSNAEDWIVREGSDTEDDESARARTLRSWSELAQRATEDTFIDAAESVPGVLFAQADCNHPRGQGTVDVIVTGTAGEATEGLIAAVREAVDKIAGPYDNMQMLVDAKTEKQRAEIDRCKRELKKADKRIEELTKILNKLYEDVALEKISEERYQAMAPKYEQEQSELRGQRERLSAEIARNDEIYDNIQQFLPLIWKYTNVQELTPHILNELIEKIVVHEKEIGEDGVKTQQVDIYYKFIGCVNIRRAKADHAEIIKAEQGQADHRTA